MEEIILIDTLFLFIRYPKSDVFSHFYSKVQDESYRNLKFGIPYGKFVIKNGSNGYKISIWQHDARAYLTDQVDEKIGKNRGMGIWLQLGPKFLVSNIENLHESVNQLISSIGVEGEFEKRISRLDLAIDLFNFSMKDIKLDHWKNGWVGRSKLSASFNNSRSGDLETINIGKRSSPVFLRVYDKVAQATKEGDIAYWFDVWGKNIEQVTRVEWEIKPNKGGFIELEKFDDLDSFRIRQLLNYLLSWGKLCLPDENNLNKTRWLLDPIWERICNFAVKWTDGDRATSRLGKEFHGISDQYIRSFFGALTSGIARFSEKEPNLLGLVQGMEKYGINLEALNEKSKYKKRIFENL